MSDSNTEFITVTGKARPSQDHGTKHQIRLEITLSAESGKINVAGIVSEVVKRANSGLIPVRFFDVHDVPFNGVTVPSGKDFVTRLAVDKVEKGKTRKVVLGFYMQSRLHMSDIKAAIGLTWLQNNRIFMRPQRMAFEHGTDLFLIGYLAKEHPLTSNMTNLENEIYEKWFPMPVHTIDGMTDDEDDPPSKEFTELVTLLNDRGIISDNKIQFPITIERNTIKVNTPGKPEFATQLLSVFVPRKYHEAATLLNDFSINERGDLSIIPFSLSKTAPDQFYQQMAQHAQYMHEHRNIPIFSVPASPYYSDTIVFPEQNEGPEVSLAQILSRHPSIYRVYPRLEEDKIQVSVIGADNYYKVCQWLDDLLPSFSYKPHRFLSRAASPENPSNAPLYPANQSKKKPFANKYQDRFAINTPTTAEFDPSAISAYMGSNRRSPKSNAWQNGPPIEASYDPTEPYDLAAEFPPLPATHLVANGGYGPQVPEIAVPPTPLRATTPFPPPDRARAGRGFGRNIPPHTTVPTANTLAHTTPPDLPPAPVSIEAIIAEAIAKSTAKLTAELADNKAKFLQIEAKFTELQQMNAHQIAAATSDATIAALTGAASPFITKDDNLQNQQQHLRTESKITAIQISLDKIISVISHLSPATQVPATPPRAHKVSKRDHREPSDSPADSATTLDPMDEEEAGVGEH